MPTDNSQAELSHTTAPPCTHRRTHTGSHADRRRGDECRSGTMGWALGWTLCFLALALAHTHAQYLSIYPSPPLALPHTHALTQPPGETCPAQIGQAPPPKGGVGDAVRTGDDRRVVVAVDVAHTRKLWIGQRVVLGLTDVRPPGVCPSLGATSLCPPLGSAHDLSLSHTHTHTHTHIASSMAVPPLLAGRCLRACMLFFLSCD